jgi:hypothetical protein
MTIVGISDRKGDACVGLGSRPRLTIRKEDRQKQAARTSRSSQHALRHPDQFSHRRQVVTRQTCQQCPGHDVTEVISLVS